jgi:hypothetical protein
MRKSIFTFAIFLSILSIQAQWSDNETNLITFDNVGIGTSYPLAKFHVKGNISQSVGGMLMEHTNHTQGISMGYDGIQKQTTNGAGILYLDGASTGTNHLAFQTRSDGNVGIGTSNPKAKLTVAGNIHSREVKVTIKAGADFVFEKDYELPTLKSIEKFIKVNKHLPEIASEKEMKESGLLLAEMNIKLLQKIGELTLYTIDQQKEIEKLKSTNDKFIEIQVRLNKLESKN